MAGEKPAVSNVFRLLAEPVQRALEELGFREPTEPQIRAVPAILKGKNILLVAPTGSGKTEAALLPVFSNLLQQPERSGISVLYVTPLRALNRDMVRRLSQWAEGLGLSVEVRHGDTAVRVRRRQALQPPDVLVTTPETLQAILPGSRMRGHLSHVRHVVVDEVHELAGDKRGAQLTVALERLREVTGREFQRVGLSATVGEPEKVARFIAGAGPPVTVIEVVVPKGYRYAVEFPVPREEDYDLAERLRTAPEAAARMRRILDLVQSHASTLIFVNSRTNAEMLGHRLHQVTPDIAVHHGSLSREERALIEDEFKAGRLRAIVCTSTLELGIDIGRVDLVVLYLSPRQVNSLIQRVGRSGHRLGLTSQGVIVTAFPDDTLEAIAATQRAYRGLLEPVSLHEGALDVLAHQVAGLLLDRGEATVGQVLGVVTRAYPYRGLSRAKLLEVVEYLDGLGRLRLEGDALRRTRGTRPYYYENLSMIPDERRYPIIDVLSDRAIGTLGDEFMALRARVGLNFICRGRVWRIVQIEDETGNVYVVPSEDPMAAIPGWDGEMIPVPFSLAQQVGRLRQEIGEELRKGREGDLEAAAEGLAARLSTDRATLMKAVEEIREHVEQGAPLPTHNRVLIEAYGKYLIVHACFGEAVNRTLGCLFDTVLSDRELITGWWNDGYRILVEAPRRIEPRDLEGLPSLLFGLTDEEVDEAWEDYLRSRFPFSYRMKFVAERFGALPRGRTMGPERLSQLPRRFRETPIYEETLREAMTERVDLPAVKRIMRDIKRGRIDVTTLLRPEAPTPLARHILAEYADLPELMAPEHVVLSNIERMRRATLMRKARLLCLSCGAPPAEGRIRDLAERPACERCGSGLLACLRPGQDPDRVRGLLESRLRGGELSGEELEELAQARRTADLVLSYGRRAVAALQVRGVGPETASRILGRMHPGEDALYMDLLKAKIQYIRTRPYWEDREKEARVS